MSVSARPCRHWQRWRLPPIPIALWWSTTGATTRLNCGYPSCRSPDQGSPDNRPTGQRHVRPSGHDRYQTRTPRPTSQKLRNSRLKGIGKKREEILRALSDLRALPNISKRDLDPNATDEDDDDNDDDLKPTIVMALDENLSIVEPHTRMLAEMSVAYASALYDGLVSDVLITVFRHVPEALRSGRTLTTAEVLGFPSREDLIEELARRETLELAYQSAEKQFSYVQRAFNIDVFGSQSLDVTIADLIAVRERRNLIIHNNGLANVSYIAKYCPGGSIGDPVIVNAESAKSDREILRKVGMAFIYSFAVKFAPSTNS